MSKNCFVIKTITVIWRCVMVVRCNIISLAVLGYLDLKQKRIPNAILLGWIATIITCFILAATPIDPSSVAMSLVTVGIFYPLRRIVKCCAGDFKLYAVLMMALKPKESLCICFLSMLMSLYPLASGIKLVPLASVTFIGYVTFLFFNLGEII